MTLRLIHLARETGRLFLGKNPPLINPSHAVITRLLSMVQEAEKRDPVSFALGTVGALITLDVETHPIRGKSKGIDIIRTKLMLLAAKVKDEPKGDHRDDFEEAILLLLGFIAANNLDVGGLLEKTFADALKRHRKKQSVDKGPLV